MSFSGRVQTRGGLVHLDGDLLVGEVGEAQMSAAIEAATDDA